MKKKLMATTVLTLAATAVLGTATAESATPSDLAASSMVNPPGIINDTIAGVASAPLEPMEIALQTEAPAVYLAAPEPTQWELISPPVEADSYDSVNPDADPIALPPGDTLEVRTGAGAVIGAVIGGLAGIPFFGIGAIPGVLIGGALGAGIGALSWNIANAYMGQA